MLKALTRSAPVQLALGLLLGGFMWLAKATTRWEVRGLERVAPFWESREGLVGCVWHSRVLMTIAGWPKGVQPPTMLISRSPDGEFVAHAARRLGVGVIRGSARNPRKTKEKGGVTAFRAMLAHIEAGGVLCITPDGPRGPRMRASLSAVRLAQAAQCKLLAYTWSSTARLVFNSWDRFMLAMPFGRGVIVWRGPFDPPRPDASEEELEALRLAIESELNAATHEADAATGAPRIEPAPAALPRPAA